ncbi:uncharacterized protein BKA78DRAFT_327612 [Phyllosticta capitalensis]|uniref:uncharacterized protein n=1 Tax=Phyllosticta capitalensis TaxID=121624 RepID=UPI0031302B57
MLRHRTRYCQIFWSLLDVARGQPLGGDRRAHVDVVDAGHTRDQPQPPSRSIQPPQHHQRLSKSCLHHFLKFNASQKSRA